MQDGRWSRFGYEVDPEWDASMQAAIQHESNGILRHQLEVERERKSQMERSDFFWAAGIVAGAFGFGLGVGALKVDKLPRWVPGSRRKRR